MAIKKDWYQSKTIVALIALLLLMLNRHFGIVLDESEIFLILSQATETLLSIFAIYGRVVAKDKIKGAEILD